MARNTSSFSHQVIHGVLKVLRSSCKILMAPITSLIYIEIERYYPHATYTRSSSSRVLEILPSTEDTAQVRWSSILDPGSPNTFPKKITPIAITLRAGESLYLPVGWWHCVRQSGLTIALNWWYDTEMRGMSWTLLNFLRNSMTIGSGNEKN